MTINGPGVLRASSMALGALLVLLSAYPYLLDVVQRRTRPQLFSWVIWTLLAAIATVAAYVEGEYASATLTAAATLETGAIAAVGWRYGNRLFELLDGVCLAGVVLGLLLWAGYDSPFVGLSAALTIDVLAAIPTVRHAWCKPGEETRLAYLLCAAAAAFSLAATPRLTLMGWLYPVYLVLINGAIAALTLRARRRSAHFAGGPRARMSGQSVGQHRAQPFTVRIPAPRMGPDGSRHRQLPAASEDGAVPGTGGPLCVVPTPGFIGAFDAEEVVGTVARPRA